MSTGLIVGTPDALRKVIASAEVGLVPTMGALHEGHLSLIQRSVAENPKTVVSIFVNHTQFTNPSDLASYPRSLEDDAGRAIQAGADIVYAPSPETVYPSGFATSIRVESLTERWEGASRPGHFAGVATVVAILINAARPARAYFGEKDYQQLVVIRRMHTDLLLPGTIVGCPTVRDDDSLALSSRNTRLTDDQRRAATVIPRTLEAMHAAASDGLQSVADLNAHGMTILAQTPEVELDYLAVVDPESLEPVRNLIPGARAIIAATVGNVRLIDNVELSPRG